MTQCVRIQVTGTVEVALPPAEAFGLFTATGAHWEQAIARALAAR